MKIIRNYISKLKIVLVFGTLMIGTSCEDYLDRTPESVISEEIAFVNFENFQGFTEELYQCIPNFTTNYWTTTWNWGEDEIVCAAGNFHVSFMFDRGNFWGWQAEHSGHGGQSSWLDKNQTHTGNNPHQKGLWPLAWYGIRKANLGLENLSRMTDATEEERQLIEGQLLFFRGWFHFMLIQYVGGLPYIDRVLPGDEVLREARLSYHESAEKAAQDFRRAADLLPINWDNTVAGRRTLGRNELRVNKIMALAYLGKNLLWAGSPLMNFESTGNRTYNADFCRRSAEAFGELLSLVEGGSTQYALMPFDRWHGNFYTTGQNWALSGGTEAIFRSLYWMGDASNFNITKQFFPSIIVDGDPTKTVPTANYVNKNFGMANGNPLPDDISRADAESSYDPSFPFKDRDPRFYSSIVFDGMQVVQGSMPPNQEGNRRANLFTNGSYRGEVSASPTGYLNRKFVPLTANTYDNAFAFGATLHLNVPYMRLADIYLMYAEAVLMGSNSVTGSSSNFSKSALEAVNVIRERAGMPGVLEKFQSSVPVFLEELRRERAVELAFERHRFNDLRRWLLLTERPYNIKTSLEFNRAPDSDLTGDPTLSRVVNLREVVILERPLNDRHYWLPLKVSDVTLYPEFSQNPGW
ncbi:RagB/SusD family nutrient uptake outer membrane protein [Belliella sp. DSM 107340]|uniref:RagB/SusD family nutrient uptake outer membrane protein n=1 Tax=Belliella calami TaxID=2923436 RepID=A0ABS9UJD9_9BACT|nr:RagB/SusD family nutrient uptake outer membrane protein [Belliella calami]MCH7396643.1 RagB/SusD family nutrient uptake outer membrane protein [Belliella calami]